MRGFISQNKRVNSRELFLSDVLELTGLWHGHQRQRTPTHISVHTSDRVIICTVAKAGFSVTIHTNTHSQSRAKEKGAPADCSSDIRVLFIFYIL